jgi:glutathione peroxidase
VTAAPKSFYELTTRTLEGEETPLSAHAGKVALVVNVASKCGYTPQYAGLEALHRELAPRGFTVLGFPSNDFGFQEPGSAEEIRSFCSTKYDVSFPLYEKRHVKGKKKDAVYAFLTRDLEEPGWNFTKYLVGRDGRVIARFDKKVKPEDAELRRAIEDALGRV